MPVEVDMEVDAVDMEVDMDSVAMATIPTIPTVGG